MLPFGYDFPFPYFFIIAHPVFCNRLYTCIMLDSRMLGSAVESITDIMSLQFCFDFTVCNLNIAEHNN